MPSPPPTTFCFLLHDAARLMRKRFEQNARQLGLTRAQTQALAYLSRNEGVSQCVLAEMLDLEPITLGRTVDRLQTMGLVERRPHESDRRVWLLFLTETAWPLVEAIAPISEATRLEALAGVSDEDRATLMRVLGTARANLIEKMSCSAKKPKARSAVG
ncbi:MULTISPECIES: MarR family winged helix-turn-helix transcriptional regulator [Methylosinus]|uniref:MarR family transcriptional regulator n=1 Tax=Methylosinus sporium TaxID=428 RepID=A0A2U1SU28_METSR|nr:MULTISPECIES: MarR family winged helix-turn-helix transcriptional regulator [Methylosinus]MBU3889546.1 MarR family winged helix-turn-helix transcriptional regulator [Methylosinus sp. KRF6]PWB95104.1 MarR family transcriptional regulator [Methylosinus sporium]TRL36781.1 winged helix-turn-helix transcriptional regulator [Methylosinus sporium]